MKHMMKIGIVIILSAFTMVGCSSKSVTPNGVKEIKDVKHANRIHVENVTVKQLRKAITSAGKQQGWHMTPFKSNEIIAEKFGEEEARACIKFSKEGYEVNSPNDENLDDLKDAIADQLDAANKDH